MDKITKQSFRRLLLRNIALPLILGLVSCAIFLGLITSLLKQTTRVDQSNKIIASANATIKQFIDAETGLRGYVITGQPNFLEPYNLALQRIPAQIHNLEELIGENSLQKSRLESASEKFGQWITYSKDVEETKSLKKDAAVIVRAGLGKAKMDEIRKIFDEFISTEESLRESRTQQTTDATNFVLIIVVLISVISSAGIAIYGRKQMLALSESYEHILNSSLEKNEVLLRQQWLKTGQTEISEKMVTEQSIASLAETVISAISQYVGASLGAFYIVKDENSLERVGTYAFKSNHQENKVIQFGEGLVGQVALQKKPLQINNVPTDYIKISSSLGDATPKHVYLFPIISGFSVVAVIEVAFLNTVENRLIEFMQQAGESIAMAIKSVQFREQRELYLAEIQNQSEELQTQQEELRVTNEELEEQTRILKDAQVRLESQHAELEQTNSHLEEQTQALEIQKNLIDQRNDDLVEAQKAIQKKADELQRASQYKTEFLANMSHELRTPLNSSLILAKLLSDNKDKNLTKSQVEFATQIVSSGNDLLNLINDILDLSKVEAGKLDINPEEFAIQRLIEHMVKEFTPIATDKKLAIKSEINSNTPPMLFTDRLRIEQVLKNLISNAIKFTSQGSVKISVETVKAEARLNMAADKEWIKIDIIDTGIGIKKEQQEIIFEAFRQADGTTNRKFGGTGLGLSISKDLARLLGGFITVDSQPDQGSTFSLTIPIRYEQSSELSSSSSLAPVSFHNRVASQPAINNELSWPVAKSTPVVRKLFIKDQREEIQPKDRIVLIVEDDEPFAKILMDLAHEHKFKCLITQHADEALELAFKYMPVAVLLDIKLADQSGLFVLDQLKQNSKTRHILVHIISGHDFSQQALMMGAIGYMMKPVTRDVLNDAFEKIEGRLHQNINKVLIVEDNEIQRGAIQKLIEDTNLQTIAVGTGAEAMRSLLENSFDCMIMDLNLPDMSGFELLERMNQQENQSYPPVIVYTGRALSRDEEEQLARYSQSVIIKGARSPERLLDEVTLFLHRVESEMNSQQKTLLADLRNREKIFESKTIMIVDDDMRNTFALTAALENKGGRIVIAKNGQECLKKLESETNVDIILMDIMMPIMDGYQTMRAIRKDSKYKNISIIALTAKAMKDDRDLCLQAGANDYLAKPVDIDKLLSLMRIWLSTSRGH